MRKSWAIPLALLVIGAASGVAIGATAPVPADDVLKPASQRLADAGRAALVRGDANGAIDAFEAALASDPKNVAAFSGIAAAYEKLGLPGRAVKYYREALALNPSDLAALEGQGKALIARGAKARAQINLARIKALCKTDCSAATRLQAAIDAPAPVVADAAKAGAPAAAAASPKAAPPLKN